ncbi:HMA2 domain-containing protein [Salinispira pacifica]|uniref:HMA2 domain-containing protein n=1 Tax=Salinispira pacifica TaxID=1307761 RepID=UPI0011822357|nr:hypothetical protein [Salinispira pacifica]
MVPRVKHALPGRLRLQIRGLKQLEPDSTLQKLIETELVSMIKGIKSIQSNLSSGTALVIYEPETVSEETVLNVFSSLAKTALKYYDKIKEHNPSPQMISKLGGLIAQDPDLLLGHVLELDDAVWH